MSVEEMLRVYIWCEVDGVGRFYELTNESYGVPDPRAEGDRQINFAAGHRAILPHKGSEDTRSYMETILEFHEGCSVYGSVGRNQIPKYWVVGASVSNDTELIAIPRSCFRQDLVKGTVIDKEKLQNLGYSGIEIRLYGQVQI